MLTSAGLPAEYIARSDAVLLEPETTTRYVDENAARYPSGSWGPAWPPILHLHPKFDFTDLDLITDREPVLKLLELASGDATEDFSFSAQVLGRAIIFLPSNSENHLQQITQTGYRVPYDKAHLQYIAEMQGTTQHYRIITYNLGTMKIMLRYAADAYLPPADPGPQPRLRQRDGNPARLLMKFAGTHIPQSSVLELMIYNSEHGQAENADLTTKLREAWLAQTHRLAVAKYTLVSTSPREAKVNAPKASFAASGLDFYTKAEILQAVKPEAVQRFCEILSKFLRDLRAQKAFSARKYFLVSYRKGEHGLRPPRACGDLRGVSKHVARRIRRPHASARG